MVLVIKWLFLEGASRPLRYAVFFGLMAAKIAKLTKMAELPVLAILAKTVVHGSGVVENEVILGHKSIKSIISAARFVGNTTFCHPETSKNTVISCHFCQF